MSLTFEERQRLRHAVSTELLARLPKPPNPCGGCGFSRDSHTRGCEACHQRHKRRRERLERAAKCATDDCTNKVSTIPHSKRPNSGYCRACANRRPSWRRT